MDRFPCGKARPEQHPDKIKAVVMAQRLRWLPASQAGDPMAGYCLGRLRLRCQPHGVADPTSIDEQQYTAGERYASICARHASIQGYATGSPRSPGFELVGNGLSCGQEPDEEYLIRCRREYSDCYRALLDVGKDVGQGIRVAIVTYDVCLDRRFFESLTGDEICNVKVGLNALARVLKA